MEQLSMNLDYQLLVDGQFNTVSNTGKRLRCIQHDQLRQQRKIPNWPRGQQKAWDTHNAADGETRQVQTGSYTIERILTFAAWQNLIYEKAKKWENQREHHRRTSIEMMQCETVQCKGKPLNSSQTSSTPRVWPLRHIKDWEWMQKTSKKRQKIKKSARNLRLLKFEEYA